MSFNIEGKQCQYCHAKLFSDDDVVICPECGAPYHRDCYKAAGHCVLEQLHGTDACAAAVEGPASEQEPPKDGGPQNAGYTYAQSDQSPNAGFVRCGNCATDYDKNASFCPKCGAPNLEKIGGNAVFFDFYGGVAPDTDLGDGVTADEAKKFVVANTNKYIPKFARIKSGKKAFFNVLAFFFPCPWFFSRKMYKAGAFIGAIEVALTTLLLPMSVGIMDAIPSSGESFSNMAEYISAVSNSLSNKTMLFILLYYAVFLAISAIHVLVGIFGDYIYRNHVISTVKAIKEEDYDSDEYEDAFRRKGGVSLLMLVLGFMLVYNLPSIIASLAGVQGL